MTETNILTNLDFPGLTLFKEGKVRSVYDFGKELLIVASDRVSAFDVILPEGIPGKGTLLSKVSKFWFDQTKYIVKNHLISTDVADFPEETKPYHAQLAGRSMYVKKTDLIEVECVVRGYLVGSGWKDYQQSGQVCGITLPEGLQQAAKLPEPIFTPASKAPMGEHDENISFADMQDKLGEELAQKLKELSFQLYTFAADYAAEKGIILADTKFEFGILDGEIILIDEALTPDSSRFWAKEDHQLGCSPPSFDKQIIRDYLENSDWNKQAPGPKLPEDIIQKAAQRYQEVVDRLL
ncbi:MAG: phosphoribosylaminoimidazolesuccinocarboxamide synthase [bacterium]